jgi:hypothetical protein
VQCHGTTGKRFLTPAWASAVAAFSMAHKHSIHLMVGTSQGVISQHLLQYQPFSLLSLWQCTMATESVCSAKSQTALRQDYHEGTVSSLHTRTNLSQEVPCHNHKHLQVIPSKSHFYYILSTCICFLNLFPDSSHFWT